MRTKDTVQQPTISTLALEATTTTTSVHSPPTDPRSCRRVLHTPRAKIAVRPIGKCPIFPKSDVTSIDDDNGRSGISHQSKVSFRNDWPIEKLRASNSSPRQECGGHHTHANEKHVVSCPPISVRYRTPAGLLRGGLLLYNRSHEMIGTRGR